MKINNIFKLIYTKNSLNKITKKINQLGPKSKIKINKFLSIKLIVLILTFVISLLTFHWGYVVAPILTVTIFCLFDYLVLDKNINKRANILEHDAIFFFEVLSLTLQSDRNLKKCLEITTNSIDSELSDEFKIVLKEAKLGKSLTESLNDCKERIPSKNVCNVLLNIIESNTYGNNIVDSLNNQIDYLMDKRILNIKEQINKMPTKISIISVILFIPIIMLLILGPILINYFFK